MKWEACRPGSRLRIAVVALGFAGCADRAPDRIEQRTAAVTTPRYRIIDLGTLGGDMSEATALNEKTQVVGTAQTAAGVKHCFLWSAGTMTDLTVLDTDICSASAINERGHVTGKVSHDDRRDIAFFFDGSTMIELATLGYTRVDGRLINDNDQITGRLNSRDCFLYEAGVMKALGSDANCVPRALNNAGQIVGDLQSLTDGTVHPFMYQDGAFVALDSALTTPQGEIVDINEAGVFTGFVIDSDRIAHAYVFKDNVQVMIDPPPGGDFDSHPDGIDEAGRVLVDFGAISTDDLGRTVIDVGSTNRLWDGGSLLDLAPFYGRESNAAGHIAGAIETNIAGVFHDRAAVYRDGTVIDLGVEDSLATHINEAGAIIGYAWVTSSSGDTHQRAMLWIPLGSTGDRCVTDDDCSGDPCVDGVCCADTCGGGADDCQACSKAAGGTKDGSCTAVVKGRACDRPPNLCDWIAATCDGTALSCPVRESWPTGSCLPVTQPTDLGTGQPGGVTVTPDGPPPSDVSIAVRKLDQPPTCPSSTPAVFKAGSPAQYWQIETSPPGTPLPATVCINFLPISPTVDQCNLQLYHGDATTCGWGSSMSNTTCTSDGKLCGSGEPPADCDLPGTICGHVDHFSPFGVFAPDPADIPSVTVPGSMVVGATNATGAVVTFAASAHDAHDGDLGVQCTPASGSMFPLGMTTVSCTATNSFRFRGQASFTVWVQVQAPTDGSFFLQPINADGTSVFKKGSTIPVKFRLTGVSAGITDLVAHPRIAKVSNGISGTYEEAASTAASDGGNTFRYAGGGQYIFNLSTKGMSTGTWSLRADLGDGIDHAILVSSR